VPASLSPLYGQGRVPACSRPDLASILGAGGGGAAGHDSGLDLVRPESGAL